MCVFWVSDLECRQWIDFGVIKSDGLESSVVTVLNNSNSGAWESEQLCFTPSRQPSWISSHFEQQATHACFIQTETRWAKDPCIRVSWHMTMVSTWFWLRVFGKGSQSVDGVDDKVLLQREVGQSHRLWAVDYKHDVQSSAAFLAVCNAKVHAVRISQPIRVTT